MTTYIVVQRGFSLVHVFGPFGTIRSAVAFAQAEADHPNEDGYHVYEVCVLSRDGISAPLHSFTATRRPPPILGVGEGEDAQERHRAARDAR